MTHVAYTRDGTGHLLCIHGHAGYDGEGKDIVCSAVSAIGYALLGFLENNFAGKYRSITESGYLYIGCRLGKRTDDAFEMALIGLMQIARNYPDNVTIHTSAYTIAGGDSREETANT